MAKKKSDKEKDTESKVPSTNKFTAFFKRRDDSFCHRVGTGDILCIFIVGILFLLLYRGSRPEHY